MRLIDADVFVHNVVKYSHQSTKTIGQALADTPTVDAIPMNVIEDIKAEISEGIDHYKHSDKAVMFGFMCALNIIDKHIEGWQE